MNGYTIYRTDSESRHTGGSAIYVRSDIIVKKVTRITFEKNMWLIALKIKSHEWNGTIASIYHSPNSDDNIFIGEFIKWCDDFIDTNENIVTCGDFNIDWNGDSVAKRKLFEWLNDSNLHQIVEIPTRITNNTSSTIDFCITNTNAIEVEAKSSLNISDHECLCIKFPKEDNNTKNYKIKTTLNYDKNAFVNDLRNIDLQNTRNLNLIERADYLITNIKDKLNKFIVQKTIPDNIICKWFNSDINRMKIHKINAYN